VLWWFVPVAQMWKPVVAVRQLLRARRRWAPEETLLFELLGTAFARLEYGAAAALRASDVAPGLWVSAVGAGVFALTTWAAIAIVRRVDARQTTPGGDGADGAGRAAASSRPG
jgi:hypothetical protein